MTENAQNSNVTFINCIEKSAEKCYDDIVVNEADSLKGEQQPMNRQEAKILSPGNHLKQLDEGIFKNREFSDLYCWQPVMVDMIIGRMEYKGCMVNLKTEKMSFRDKKARNFPKKNGWFLRISMSRL